MHLPSFNSKSISNCCAHLMLPKKNPICFQNSVIKCNTTNNGNLFNKCLQLADRNKSLNGNFAFLRSTMDETIYQTC
jgi:hypothetical protein